MQRLFIVFTFLGLGLYGLSGCSGESSASGDCRNGEPICIDGFSCQQNDAGGWECLPDTGSGAAGGADIEGARSERGRTCTAHLAAG